LIDKLKVLMVFVWNDMHQMLEEIFVLELSGKDPLCVFLVRPVRIRPLCCDHNPPVHGSLQLGATEKSNLK
jgi:hypothetical protein